MDLHRPRRAPAKRLAWLVILAWAALAVVGTGLAGDDDALADDDTATLPSSTPRLPDADPRDRGGRRVEELVVVLSSPDRFSAAQLDAAAALAEELADARSLAPAAVRPLGELRPTPDGRAAVVELELAVPAGEEDDEAVADAVGQVSDLVAGAAPPGVAASVTGEAALEVDTETGGVNAELLLTSVLVVAVLLVLVYRSPVLWLLPVLSGLAAVQVARGGVALAARAGLPVTETTVAILIVAVFGVGTDYALLVLDRYRRTRPGRDDAGGALTVAVRRAARPVLTSAAVVVAALTTFLLASTDAVRGTGPALAIGVVVAAAAQLTMLPALLRLAGDRAFWPVAATRPRPEPRRWAALARLVFARPRTVAVASGALVAGLAVLATSWQATADPLASVPGSSDARAGAVTLREHAGAGVTDPVTVVDPGPGTAERLARDPDVEHVEPGTDDAGEPVLEVTLEPAAYFPAWDRGVDRITRDLEADGVVVAGDPVSAKESEEAVARDVGVLAVAVALVLTVLLLVLWRSALTVTVVLAGTLGGFLAALGLGWHLFGPLTDGEQSTWRVVLFSMLFLVTFGVDYAIFLLDSVREKRRALGRSAVPAALVDTGGVITAAGVVLAATFALLLLVPEVSARQVGLVVAVGVLLDTVVVRSLLIPAVLVAVEERSARRRPAGRGSGAVAVTAGARAAAR